MAEVREHWKGPFHFGAPDGIVVNVTKDRIWSREAAVPEGAAIPPLDPRWLMPPPLPEELELPRPEMPREEQQEQLTRDLEIDPGKYYPEDVERPPLTKLEDPLTINLKAMLAARNPKKAD